MKKDEILTKDVKDLLNQIIIRLRLNDVESPKGRPKLDRKFENIRLIAEALIKELEPKDDGHQTRTIAENYSDYYSSTC